jgi:hypothetical protein
MFWGKIWRSATEGSFSKTDVEHCLECLEVGLVNGSEIKAGHAKEPRTKVKAPLISPSLGALTPDPKVHKPIGVKVTRPNFYTKPLRCLKSSNLCLITEIGQNIKPNREGPISSGPWRSFLFPITTTKSKGDKGSPYFRLRELLKKPHGLP